MLFNVFVFLCGVNVILGGHWGYDGESGTSEWAKLYPEFCGGQSQSPVNIDVGSIKQQAPNFKLVNYKYNLLKSLFASVSLTNNGHSAQVSGDGIKGHLETSFRDIPAVYDFLQFHFHWGPDSSVGSEHTINGKSYPLELHIVHSNRKYKGTTDFLKKKDGLSVVGIMFEISPQDNPDLHPVTDNLQYVTKQGSTKSLGALLGLLQTLSLDQFLPNDLSAYHYQGSLTTPTCNEVVDWIVLSKPVPISNSQLAQFRLLKEGDASSKNILTNFRPVQPMNGRPLFSTKGTLVS